MKVLVITSHLNKQSGWGTYSNAILNELQNKGIAYKVVVEYVSDSHQANTYILNSRRNIVNFLRNILFIRKIARSFGVVHCFDGWPYGVYGYFAVLGTKKKLLINCVGTYSVQSLNQRGKSLLLRLSYRRAYRVFPISHYTQSKILAKVKLSNTEVIIQGSPKVPIASRDRVDGIRKQYALIEKNPIFLTVGAVKPRKGQDVVVRALVKFKKEYPNFIYFIAGPIENKIYAQEIKDFCQKNDLSDNVKILGLVDAETLAALYGCSKYFILASVNQGDHFEGFGLVLLEAAQFGLPVIGSRNCGIEEALLDGYNGYLVEQKNPEDIYAKIIKLINMDYKLMSDHSREFAQRFSWEEAVKSYIKYY